MVLKIVIDDLSDARVHTFLAEHIQDMQSVSPPESKHALDLAGLRQADIQFWSVWDNGVVIACGALKALSHDCAEIKSMRVAASYPGQGVASHLLSYMLEVARQSGINTVYLETGAMAFFEPARQLYQKFGFQYCPPFGGYVDDPNSVFMQCVLSSEEASTGKE